MQNLYGAQELSIRKKNEARKQDARNRRMGLREEGERRSVAQAHMAARAPPLVFRPPSPVMLPPEPAKEHAGAPVRLFDRENIDTIESSLRGYLLRPARGTGPLEELFPGEHGSGDVVLTMLEPGAEVGLQNERAEGELARHGCWYHYQPNNYKLGRRHAEAVGKGWQQAEAVARRPQRLQNISALYISGDATAIDFASLAGCVITKPPKLLEGQSEGALSAVEVLKRGPGYGPHTLFLHGARVDGRTLESLAQALQSNPLVDGMCTLDTLIFVNNCLKSVQPGWIDKLLDSFKRNYRLAVIRFSMNQIADPTATRILSAVTGCQALQTLILSDNVIGDG
jgi:hypothetical protein